MYGRQGNSGNAQPPPWLVRAEVTIRHGNPVTSEASQTTPQSATSTVTDPSGVRMVCRWSTDQLSANQSAGNSQNDPVSSDSPTSFEFRRGNILFTSTPPTRPAPTGAHTNPRSEFSRNDDSTSSRNRGGVNVSDSGYTSERFSPTAGTLPTSAHSQSNNRRCKSTCSIVLSAVDIGSGSTTTFPEKAAASSNLTAEELSKRSWRDSWYSRSAHQHLSTRYRFSTVPEVCEDCADNGAMNSGGFSTHFCTRVSEKSANKTASISKDASSQTTDIESRCSSAADLNSRRTKGKTVSDPNKPGKQKIEEQENRSELNTPAGITSASSTTEQEKSDTSTKDDSLKRKSRTVHIDVYCTGTDDNSSSESLCSSNERDTPMTVFENEDIRVTHTRATDSILPRGFQDNQAFLKRTVERRCESIRHTPMRMPSLASSKGYESDDVLSSLYPSQFSSCSALRDIDSVPWSAASSTTVLPFDEYESTVATSSKDTFSDVESLVNSKSGLTPCDSFEYANTSARSWTQRPEPIRTKTDRQEKNKTWRSPHIERKHLLRNRKMREYLEEHDIGWSSGGSDPESDESDTVGWTFVSNDENPRVTHRDSTIRRASKDKTENAKNSTPTSVYPEFVRVQDQSNSKTRNDDSLYTCSLRDRIGPFGSNSPSPVPSKIPSRVTSPFTTPQGEKTDHIAKASIFGTVVNAFRKPGHHIGPSKNPSCSCEHCRRYFEEEYQRERTRSIGEYERRFGRRLQKEIRPTPVNSPK